MAASELKSALVEGFEWLRDYVTAITCGRVHAFSFVERKCRAATRDEAWCATPQLSRRSKHLYLSNTLTADNYTARSFYCLAAAAMQAVGVSCFASALRRPQQPPSPVRIRAAGAPPPTSFTSFRTPLPSRCTPA